MKFLKLIACLLAGAFVSGFAIAEIKPVQGVDYEITSPKTKTEPVVDEFFMAGLRDEQAVFELKSPVTHLVVGHLDVDHHALFQGEHVAPHEVGRSRLDADAVAEVGSNHVIFLDPAPHHLVHARAVTGCRQYLGELKSAGCRYC